MLRRRRVRDPFPFFSEFWNAAARGSTAGRTRCGLNGTSPQVVVEKCYEQWLPFRQKCPEAGGCRAGERVHEEVIGPLEELVARVSAEGGHPPHPTRQSLATVLTAVKESLPAIEEAGAVETLEEAWTDWESRLEIFRRDGGEAVLTRAGHLPHPGREAVRQLHLSVREAIGNAVKHAAASKIEVVMSPWEKGCAVIVADDGRGMPEAPEGGIGLEMMRRRMARCGGELQVRLEEGTVVEFRLPKHSPTLWEWLLAEGRPGRGVIPERARELENRWHERVDRFGSIERVCREWPTASRWIAARLPENRRAPAALTDVPRWLERELADLDAAELAGVHGESAGVTCRISGTDSVDPLHWLELALVASLRGPVVLRTAGATDLELWLADRPDWHGLDPRPGNGFIERLKREWADGLPPERGDLSSYLHDVLAQELAAEAMRWEMARELVPAGPQRVLHETCQRELQSLSKVARALSHDLAAEE